MRQNILDKLVRVVDDLRVDKRMIRIELKRLTELERLLLLVLAGDAGGGACHIRIERIFARGTAQAAAIARRRVEQLTGELKIFGRGFGRRVVGELKHVCIVYVEFHKLSGNCHALWSQSLVA